MTNLRYLHIGVLVSLLWETASPWQPWPVPPRDIMADITNDLGICLLQVIGRDSRENIAFSPYGVMSVVFLLYEGSHGNTAIEIYNSLRLPWDRHMSRIGFRDLHRHVKSYFSNDRFLKGLVLSKPSVPLRYEYVKLLNFYGFYPNKDGSGNVPLSETSTSSHIPETPWTDHQGRNPTTADYYPHHENTDPQTKPTRKPAHGTTPPHTTINGYTISTNTQSTFATFPNFETEPTEPTVPPYEPTKSRTKTTPTYTTFDNTDSTRKQTFLNDDDTTAYFPRTTTSPSSIPGDSATVKHGFNGHGMTQFFPDSIQTESTLHDEDEPTIEDNIIFPDGKQTTRHYQDHTDPFSGTDTDNFDYTKKQTTQPTPPSDFDFTGNDHSDNFPTESNDEHNGHGSTDTDTVVFPTESTNADDETTGIDVRLGQLKKLSTVDVDNAETTSILPNIITYLPKKNDVNIVENLIKVKDIPVKDTATQETVQNPTDQTQGTTLNVKATQATTINAQTSSPDVTTFRGQTVSGVNGRRKNNRIIMTLNDVENANKKVESLGMSYSLNSSELDLKPTLATILSTIVYSNADTNKESTNMFTTEMGTKSMSDDKISETTEQTTEETTTEKEKPTTTRPTVKPSVGSSEPTTTESFISFTNMRMPISKEMATMNPMITKPMIPAKKNSSGDNTGTEAENTTRWKRHIIPPEIPYDHRDGSNNWIPNAEGPHWEYNVPRDQWFYTYSGSEPVQVLTYTDYLPFAFIDNIDSMALQLPLDDPRYSMLLLLPLERYGLEQLLGTLHHCTVRDILQSLKVGPVHAVIPAFTLVKHLNIVPALEMMGIEEVFDPLRADLSGMAEEPHLYVRSIEQLVTVSLRKYHYTSRRYDGPPDEIRHHFIANHPFVYFVLDTETNAALMAGTIVNPSECTPGTVHQDS